ncbi:hypothetical protein [Streptomyces sp. NPDC054865]
MAPSQPRADHRARGEVINRIPTRVAVAAMAAILLAAGCSSTGDSDKTIPQKDTTSKSPDSAGLGLVIRPGQDLLAHQGVAVLALDRETLQIRKQVTVPEPVAPGLLAGTGSHSRSFDSTFHHALLGAGGMSASGADGALKVADLTAAGTDKAVLTLSREQLTAAGVIGTISGAQFTGSPKASELWFQTSPADSPSGETWSSATSSRYKITSLWSVNVKDWQAGRHTVQKVEVPADIQEYWRSQECQTAFSRNPGQEGFTPWSCWLVDASGIPVASGPVGARTVKGTVDTAWTNPAKGMGTEKATFSYVRGSDGKPAAPLSVSGPGGNGASTLDGTSGLIDSGSAARGERKMWRFTTAGAELKLQPLSKTLPVSADTDEETELWAFPDGRAVAKVGGGAPTGWILTEAGEWKNVGPWPAELQEAEVEPTA